MNGVDLPTTLLDLLQRHKEYQSHQMCRSLRTYRPPCRAPTVHHDESSASDRDQRPH